MTIRTGFLALARTTFDVPFAEESARQAHSAIDRSSTLDLVGTPGLATDSNEVQDACRVLDGESLEGLVVFQATFADSTLVKKVADRFDVPLVLWAVSEERTGGRLRLNSFCGINLAGYVLARDGVDYRWVYRQPGDPVAIDEIISALSGGPARVTRSAGKATGKDSQITLVGKTIGVIGDRPDGFEPCDYEPGTLQSVFGVSVDYIPIDSWFEGASEVSSRRVDEVQSSLDPVMEDLNDVDQDSLSNSLHLYLGLNDLVTENHWDGVATRCWPECFTEFGGAACAGNSMLTSSGTPGSCEADVYGNLTALLLQEITGEPALVADLVDLDRVSNTAVFWHCGLAPQEMAGVTPRATVHSNRRQPLLYEFPLRPGRVTIARVSQSRNEIGLVVGGAEMVEAGLPFSGTSGVATLDSPVDEALETIMGEGLEHHYGIVYGDHRQTLRAYANELGIRLIEL